MMNPAIVKDLLDAGFPFRLTPFEKGDPSSFGRQVESLAGVSYLVPLIEELIAVCGTTYMEDQVCHEFSLAYSIDKWFATYNDHNFKSPKVLLLGSGATQADAVAKLYIDLRKIGTCYCGLPWGHDFDHKQP